MTCKCVRSLLIYYTKMIMTLMQGTFDLSINKRYSEISIEVLIQIKYLRSLLTF